MVPFFVSSFLDGMLAEMFCAGPSIQWVQSHYNAWLNDFSWEKAEARIKSWHHFTTSLEDLTVHFVHEKSRNQNAIPLLLLHGWPGTFYEFADVIEPFTNPELPDAPAFDVVIPSLPGFCWSEGPKKHMFTLQDTAKMYDQLMKRLGYQTYTVQCGDWGHYIGRELGANYSSSCKAMHTNYCSSEPPPGMELLPREKLAKDRLEEFTRTHMGYAQEMRTRVGVLPGKGPPQGELLFSLRGLFLTY